jgi:hypothetical protein|tara:strand:- start:2428 stop:2559 length:132 start_codon:yes stop_codon:yes gene_type:complete
MNEIKKLKKKLEKEAEEGFELDEDSDIPIHEKHVKEKKIKRMK